MSEPTFDRDGYPSEETLRQLREWPAEDVAGALDFMKAAWHYPSMVVNNLRSEELAVIRAEAGDRFLRCVTGGWSGNEELLRALENNLIVFALTWKLSGRGGLHIFQYPAHPEPKGE